MLTWIWPHVAIHCTDTSQALSISVYHFGTSSNLYTRSCFRLLDARHPEEMVSESSKNFYLRLWIAAAWWQRVQKHQLGFWQHFHPESKPPWPSIGILGYSEEKLPTHFWLLLCPEIDHYSKCLFLHRAEEILLKINHREESHSPGDLIIKQARPFKVCSCGNWNIFTEFYMLSPIEILALAHTFQSTPSFLSELPTMGLAANALETLVEGCPTRTLVSESKRESPTLTGLSERFRYIAKDISIHG